MNVDLITTITVEQLGVVVHSKELEYLILQHQILLVHCQSSLQGCLKFNTINLFSE